MEQAGTTRKNLKQPRKNFKQVENSKKRLCFKKDYTVRKTQKQKFKLKFSFTTLLSLC